MTGRIGYTTGIFDLFHIGHLNLLKNAKSLCDWLIVGVTTDELAYQLKGKKPIIPFNERIEIINNIIWVDEAIPENEDDKFKVWESLQFDVIFKGDDWKGTEKWRQLESIFNEVGVEVIYLPYTKNTSSTLIRSILDNIS